MLPDYDNFIKWLDWFKEKKLYKIWLFLPIILFVFMGILIHEYLELRSQLNNMIVQVEPITALYPKLELSGAVAKLLTDYDTIKKKTSELENKLKPRNISPTDLVRLIAMLKKGVGKKVRVGAMSGIPEADNLAKVLWNAFKKAGWETDNFNYFSGMTVEGILVSSKAPKTSEANLIQVALSKIGLESRWMPHSEDITHVEVGAKPVN